MKSDYLEIASREDCDEYAANFLQTGFWGNFKSEFGWTPHYLSWKGETILVLERKLFSSMSFLYLPFGPMLANTESSNRIQELTLLANELKILSSTAIFARFDLPWFESESINPDQAETTLSDIVRRPVLGTPFKKAVMDVQPPDTVILSLANNGIPKSDEEILSNMKPKWRYNIKLAGKKGVVVTEENIENIDSFYSMYEITSKRDHIAIHPKSYYQKLFSLAKMNNKKDFSVKLWIARHEGSEIAAIITFFYKNQAIYLYGASVNEKRNLMPAYALQWEAIKAARDSGCLVYDMFGIPPNANPSHPMAGLYRFKTGFGGEIIHYGGSWDYSYKKSRYNIFRIVEKLRKYWYKKLTKKKHEN